MTSHFQRFSAIQYYLAHARNCVHAIAEVPRRVSDTEFQTLVRDIITAAPQLLWCETLEDHGHHVHDNVDWASQCAYSAPQTEACAAQELHATLSAPLHDTGLPAFRALCQVLPNETTRIAVITTHALMEGGDVADLLRGRRSDHGARAVAPSGASFGTRAGAFLFAPIAWVLNLTFARLEKKDRTAFGFQTIQFDRGDLRRVASELGMGQRDLAFALVSYHRGRVPTNKTKLFAAYSSRPSARVRLCDDEVLSLRMDEITVPHSDDFSTFATHMRDALIRRGPEPMFVQTLHRRLNQMHRFLFPRVPWLYPKQLFGFAPYDVVLSLLPPVRTSAGVLDGAVIYAGSDTGTAESCIFAASTKSFTVTLWSGVEREAHILGIEQTAADLEIATRRAWGRST